jgi:hypothetical protein
MKPGPKAKHFPGCPVPAQAPRAEHIDGCPYREPRSGKRVAPDVQRRPRLTAKEAEALARARAADVNVAAVLDAASLQNKAQEEIDTSP